MSSEEVPLKIGHTTYQIGNLVEYEGKEYKYLGQSNDNSAMLGEVFHKKGDEIMLVDIHDLNVNNFRRRLTERTRRHSAPLIFGSKLLFT